MRLNIFKTKFLLTNVVKNKNKINNKKPAAVVVVDALVEHCDDYLFFIFILLATNN